MTTFYFSKKFLSFYTDSQVPLSVMPADVVVISEATYKAMQAAIKNGMVISVDGNGQPVAIHPAPQPKSTLTLSTEQILSKYSSALRKAIDAEAMAWQYDNITSAATYLHSTIPQFAAEAKALLDYRDTAWHNAKVLFARIKAGTSQLPQNAAAFLSIVLPPTPVRPVVS